MLAARFRLSNRVAAMFLFPLAQRWPYQTASPAGRRSVGAKTQPEKKRRKKKFPRTKVLIFIPGNCFWCFFLIIIGFLEFLGPRFK
jgi:hypothetical protein